MCIAGLTGDWTAKAYEVAGAGASSGMAKEFAKAFYKSKAWQKCRAAYIQSVFGLCEKCQRPGWIVHHKETLTPANINDPNVTLNWKKLEYLCMDCHNREHGGASTAEGLVFDANGDLVAMRMIAERYMDGMYRARVNHERSRAYEAVYILRWHYCWSRKILLFP